MEEIFDIVDKNDVVTGIAARSEVHGNPDLIHRVVHILVFNSKGELFLQKRSINKDIQPGKWDTSVGGHLDSGETYEEAGFREMKEELYIETDSIEFIHKYLHTNEIESEYVSTFLCVFDGVIKVCENEIEEGRFFTLKEIEETKYSGKFTPNFIHEFDLFMESGYCESGSFIVLQEDS
ncbi:MAG: NUDIX domain-containing protein [Desulfobacterales bacterium]|nr:NUDIX domain-containing protein [Desulfobacterales bacterium]